MEYLKARLYKWFCKYYSKELALDFEKKTSETIKATYENAEALAKQYYEGIIEKKVGERYSARNWLVDPNSVILITNSGAYLNHEPIMKDKAKQLKQEATFLTGSLLWNILTNTLRQKAIEKSVMESLNYEQVMFGKAMVHNLSLIESIVNRLEVINTDKIPDVSGRESLNVI